MTSQRLRTGAIVLSSAALVFAGLGAAAPVSAATKTTKKAATKAAAKKVAVVPACATQRTTTVAVFNNRKFGAAISVYNEPSTAQRPVYQIGVGLEIKGAVVFTVNQTQGDWLNVNVPQRPNGATGWVQRSDVTTFTHKFTIRVAIGQRQLVVCNGNRVIQTEKVVVGKPSTPTPIGTCYTVELVRPKGGASGAYGPYAFGLSCFSENPELEDFNGGEGRIGIHGTSAPKLLGTANSHGCIRVSNAGITKLAKTIPLGVPVEIAA